MAKYKVKVTTGNLVKAAAARNAKLEILYTRLSEDLMDACHCFHWNTTPPTLSGQIDNKFCGIHNDARSSTIPASLRLYHIRLLIHVISSVSSELWHRKLTG